MSKCFVIQPFDSAEFDKRYKDILKPAIERMGLERTIPMYGSSSVMRVLPVGHL